jgi:hypothetical protein
MPKGFISKDYVVLVIVAGAVAVLLMGAGFFSRPGDWAGWVQATGLIVGMMVAVAVPGIQRSQEAAVQHKAMREREIGYARRMQYLCGELVELLGKISLSLNHLRATDRHRLQNTLQDYLHRLIDELESGRTDRVVFMSLEKRLQRLTHRSQVNAAMAEKL